MKSLPTQAILGAGTAVLGGLLATALGSVPLAFGVVTLALAVYVAFAAQSQRLRDDDRLVYRPVHVRRQGVQRRVRSDD